MREFNKVGYGFWTSSVIRSLSDDARTLALYFITCPHNTSAGVFRCPPAYIADDLQWSLPSAQPDNARLPDFVRVEQAVSELSRKGFATLSKPDFWVVIHKHFTHNPIENPNQGKHVAKMIEAVPLDSSAAGYIKAVIIEYKHLFTDDVYARIMTYLRGVDPNPFETVTKPFRNTETETETETKTETKTNTLMSGLRPTPPPEPVDKSKSKPPPEANGKNGHDANERAPPIDDKERQRREEMRELRKQAVGLLDFLNSKTSNDFKPVPANIDLIVARLLDGPYTPKIMRQVIAKKAREWSGETKMKEYLRPKTLFNRTNFAQYAGEIKPDAVIVMPSDTSAFTEEKFDVKH